MSTCSCARTRTSESCTRIYVRSHKGQDTGRRRLERGGWTRRCSLLPRALAPRNAREPTEHHVRGHVRVPR